MAVVRRNPRQRAEARYESLLRHMSEGFVECEAIFDAEGGVCDYWLRNANPVFLARAPPQLALLDRRQLELWPSTPPAWFAACSRALAGEPVRFEFLEALAGRWYEVHMMRLSRKAFGQLFIDVTARKHAEQRQSELFDELNHRVKNNLAIVSAILALQARTASDSVREELEKAGDRINAIADLHTVLYRQSSTQRVRLRTYLQDLTVRMSATLLAGDHIAIWTSCDDVELTASQAVNVGLIVNELVTNAIKHAFRDAETGRVEVSCTRVGARLRLMVRDSGPGFESETSRPPGLGLRIVNTLVAGLSGELHRPAGPGGTIIIEFPKDEAVLSPRI